jgi:hypothetical protein
MSSFKDIAVSWVLYAIRETNGLSIVRNDILRSKINKSGKYKKDEIYYGETFTSGNTFDDIYGLFNNFEGSDKQILIFTSNGEVRKNTRKRARAQLTESHYVSFVIEKRESKVTIIDPSRNNGKIGIYNPYIGIALEPFFRSKGYKVKWLEMSSPCQINHHDVFCQSWTIYLVYKYLVDDDPIIHIPTTQRKKYRKLLLFFKSLLDFKMFRKELFLSYKDSIKNHENRIFLQNYNPRSLLNTMETNDMNDMNDSEESYETEHIDKLVRLDYIDLTSQ